MDRVKKRLAPWVFIVVGVPSNGWLIRIDKGQSPLELDGLGLPDFRKAPFEDFMMIDPLAVISYGYVKLPEA